MKTVSCVLLTTFLSLGLGHSPVMADMGGELSQLMIEENSTQYHAQRSQRPKNRGRIMEQLGLSEEQTQELNSIRQKYQPQLRSLRRQIRNSREEMYDMMTGNASQAELRSKNQEINQIDQKIHNLRFESLLEVREVLTPEQRQEFAQLMEERREMRGPRSNRSREGSEGEGLMP
ncbi:MAG: Spy/CpxP family protein refolding chaperone [Microcystaceae cyanobacterium]